MSDFFGVFVKSPLKLRNSSVYYIKFRGETIIVNFVKFLIFYMI